MRIFYRLSISVYHLLIILVSPFNTKAKQWKEGRRGLFEELKTKCADVQNIVCFHCASLGEFEQGKPLMQKLKAEQPHLTIMVTFFSPSGYEVKKNDPVADIITYLPIDTPKQMRRFLDIVNPLYVIFIKYEFWFNMIDELAKRNIPFYYVSAIFRPEQLFFKPYGKWFVQRLQKASYFFVQNEKSKELLSQIGIQKVEITGDTRFDRVKAIATQQFQLDFVINFKSDSKLIVAGSTWKPDEQLLKQVLHSFSTKYKLMIAPHLIDAKHLNDLRNEYKAFKTMFYSEIKDQPLADYEVMIIDTIGMLSKLYKYADISYVGGAFATGLHNILEAAVYGVPLFFGPKYQKFNEAIELTALGGSFSINNATEMINKITLFESNQEEYQQVCTLCKQYVERNLGACDKIHQTINNEGEG